MGAITNYDLFEEFYNFATDPDNNINDVIKEFGGSSLYIPSAKTTIRNDEIINEYKENRHKKGIIQELGRKHQLSDAQVYAITKEVREPTLF